MLVDDAVATAYYSQVRGAQNNAEVGGFVYPCNTPLPEFAVSIGPTYMGVIPPDGITFAQVDQNTCFGGIQSNGGANLQIYGGTLLKTQFAVFDGGNNQLGIAPKN